MIEVWHFSPSPDLSILIPRRPPEYSDIEAVYLALSLDWCQTWANAMTSQGYHTPPFYIYKGRVQIKSLCKLTTEDGENFQLSPVEMTDLQGLDQVLCIEPVPVELYQIYSPNKRTGK